MPTRIFHYAVVSLCIALLIGQMGCSHRVVISPLRPAPLSEPVRAQLGTVGVVSARYSPEVNIEVRPVVGNSGSSEGAGKGALAGTAVGAGSALTVLPYALYFPPLLIVAGAMFVVGAVGGAIAGAIYGSDDIEEAPESFEDAELAFEKASDDPIVQVAMRDQVIQASQGLPSHNVVLLGDEGLSPPGDKADYDAWARRGIDSVLETQVENVTLLVEEGFDPLLALDMSVSSRVVRTQDGTQVDSRTFMCRGGKRTFREWSANGVQPFSAGLSRCYEQIAARMVEELFLVYDSAGQTGWSFGGMYFGEVALDSLQPALEWEAFPGLGFPEVDTEGVLSRIRRVSYDLRVWRADNNDLPDDLVYLRHALPTPQHKLEEPLEPSTKYFWTVRARFELDGQTRVTPWAVNRRRKGYSPDHLDRVTNPFYYRFETPPGSTVATSRE